MALSKDKLNERWGHSQGWLHVETSTEKWGEWNRDSVMRVSRKEEARVMKSENLSGKGPGVT